VINGEIVAMAIIGITLLLLLEDFVEPEDDR